MEKKAKNFLACLSYKIDKKSLSFNCYRFFIIPLFYVIEECNKNRIGC